MRASQDTPGALDAWRPQPHPVSGVLECPAELTFAELVEAAQISGWSADGLHPEPARATIGELLEQRQPRPRHFCDGLLSTRVCRVVVSRTNATGYVSALAPRKASGPDLAYLFIGGEGRLGHIERASIALVRPAPRYVRAHASFEAAGALFHACRAVALLDPYAIRRVDWPGRAFEAWVPLRMTDHSPLQEALEELGLATELARSVPNEVRLAPERPAAPRLALSASYARLADLLETAGSSPEPLDVSVHHADVHGAAATLGGPLDRLERLFSSAAEHPHWDDLWLERAAGDVEWRPRCDLLATPEVQP